MKPKKRIQPGEKVPLKLTATERKLVLEDLVCLDLRFRANHSGNAFGQARDDDPR